MIIHQGGKYFHAEALIVILLHGDIALNVILCIVITLDTIETLGVNVRRPGCFILKSAGTLHGGYLLDFSHPTLASS